MTDDLRKLAPYFDGRKTLDFDAIESTTIPAVHEFPVPAGWRVLNRSNEGGAMYRVPGGLRVIASAEEVRETGEVWAHISASKKGGGLPNWSEMVSIRDALLGDDVEAYQVCPPKGRYVNLAPVLHWWACLSKPEGVLPRFDAVVDGVRTI